MYVGRPTVLFVALLFLIGYGAVAGFKVVSTVSKKIKIARTLL
jgi:hypothetical protein